MNCDAIARHYQWMEFAVFGRSLERCRARFLPELSNVRRALLLGDGDGRFLRRLLENCPNLQADYVDRSAKMLAIARRRAGNNRVSFQRADVLSDALPLAEYDLVAAHFFFDCFDCEQLRQVIERVASAAPGAQWLVSEFGEAEGWLSIPSGLLIWMMYRFFGLTTGLKTRRLTDHRPLMRAAGFRLARRDKWAGGLLASELWAARA
jgi:SAM-dependent methyltransferase